MIEGQLDIDLFCNGDGVKDATIASSRPVMLAKVFEGKPPADLLKTIPLLFSVCSVAQGRAASAAVEKALGVAPCKVSEAARACLVHGETAREHLLRIVLEWPAFLDADIDKEAATRVTPLLPALRAALFSADAPFDLGARACIDEAKFRTASDALEEVLCDFVFGEPVSAWLSRKTLGDLEGWAQGGTSIAARLIKQIMDKDWRSAGDVPVYFLPDLDAGAVAERLGGEDAVAFMAQPEWDGFACETSALARQHDTPLIRDLMAAYGTGLLTRAAARLMELARIPQQICELADEIGAGAPLSLGEAIRDSGEGLSQIEAARGRLIHAVTIDKGIVTRYRILAPTEWNFHPEGIAANALRHLMGQGEEDLTDQARLLIETIDPCVGYELRVH